ncbi:MAG: zf-HC2 domain-containing protein [Planctomycetota bacterium]
MDCEAFVTELPELLYGELPPERAAAAEEHAAGCAACGELMAELRAVRGALPTVTPPPTLGTRLKLLARDELLAGEPRPPIDARGGPLHLVTVGVLAACLIGFGLGIAFERRREPGLAALSPSPGPSASPSAVPGPSEPSLPLPRGPADIDLGPGLQVTDPPPPTPVPRAPAAWQRVLYDAGQSRLGEGRLAEARTFFLRAAKLDPEGPLTAAAEVGAAEALLREGQRSAALAELEATRRAILAGKRYGTGAVLQRIAELVQEAEGPR